MCTMLTRVPKMLTSAHTDLKLTFAHAILDRIHKEGDWWWNVHFVCQYWAETTIHSVLPKKCAFGRFHGAWDNHNFFSFMITYMTAHTIEKYHWKIYGLPRYCPSLVPSDKHLKNWLASQKFQETGVET